MNIEKLSVTAKKLNTFFKVLQKILSISVIVVLCVLTTLTVLNAIDPDTVIGTDLNVLEIGPIAIELAEEYTPEDTSILGYSWIYAVLGIVCAAVVYAGLGYIRKILQPMAEGSPFHQNTSRYLKKLAFLSLILGVVQNIGVIVETVSALQFFGLNKLIENTAIKHININVSFEFGFIIVFFVLLLMSYIFSYGAELQKLSDETL